MKKLLHIAVLGFLLTSVQAQAEDEKTMQQNKMTACTQQTEGLKGDAQKMKLKECMDAKAMNEKKPKGAQQEKMKRCNAEAKGMKGDERKMKMSACLKG